MFVTVFLVFEHLGCPHQFYYIIQDVSGICLLKCAFQIYHSVFSIQNRLEVSQGCGKNI